MSTDLPEVWRRPKEQDNLYYEDRQTIDINTPIDRYGIEAQYAPVPDATVRAVRKLVNSDRTKGDHVEKVARHDETAVEVVWYDDWGEDDDDDDDRHSSGPTKVSDYVLTRLQEDLQSFFGELWRVDRKPDDRRRDGKNVQRALVRRVSHLDFAYSDDDAAEVEFMRNEKPDGVADWVEEWGDCDHWRDEPNYVDTDTNLYLYETSTGTQHLLTPTSYRYNGFYHSYVTEGGHTVCGRGLDPQTLADPTNFEHFPVRAHEHQERLVTEHDRARYDIRVDPMGVLGDQLCGSCWRSYAKSVEQDDGADELVPPNHDWTNMASWGESLADNN